MFVRHYSKILLIDYINYVKVYLASPQSLNLPSSAMLRYLPPPESEWQILDIDLLFKSFKLGSVI